MLYIFRCIYTIYTYTYRLLNHFPNHFELTRKDLMVKNIKRYYKVRYIRYIGGVAFSI